MATTILFFCALCFISVALADFMPTGPGPNDVYQAGKPCLIQWDADATGIWTNVTIDLMSGSNSNMTIVSTVTSGLDGTKLGLSPWNWTCPEVQPYSAIYFYQFTNGIDQATSKWTTRFTIASPTGESSPPENPLQPNGDSVSWGDGHLSYSKDSGMSTDPADANKESSDSFLTPAPAASVTSAHHHTHSGSLHAEGQNKVTDTYRSSIATTTESVYANPHDTSTGEIELEATLDLPPKRIIASPTSNSNISPNVQTSRGRQARRACLGPSLLSVVSVSLVVLLL